MKWLFVYLFIHLKLAYQSAYQVVFRIARLQTGVWVNSCSCSSNYSWTLTRACNFAAIQVMELFHLGSQLFLCWLLGNPSSCTYSHWVCVSGCQQMKSQFFFKDVPISFVFWKIDGSYSVAVFCLFCFLYTLCFTVHFFFFYNLIEVYCSV